MAQIQPSTDQILQQNKTSQVEKKLLFARVDQLNNLPTPSASVMKIMLLLRDENVNISELVHYIEKDQSLVAQILKLVNSGFYGLRNTIDSVEQAVSLLGILNIKQIIYSASIMEFFSNEEQLEWQHAYSASIMMSTLIRENAIAGTGNLPLAMLMHDLGKIVIRKFTPKKYQIVHLHAQENQIPLYRIENAMLQFNHAEVGAYLLQKWDTTEEIVKPVMYHHYENVPPDYVLETALVQFVNWIDCTVRGITCFPPSQALLEAAGIEEIDADYWIQRQSEVIENISFHRDASIPHAASAKVIRPQYEETEPENSAPSPVPEVQSEEKNENLDFAPAPPNSEKEEELLRQFQAHQQNSATQMPSSATQVFKRPEKR